MHPFQTNQDSLDRSPAMNKRIDDFREVLKGIRGEMQALASRRLRLRVLHYARDASNLASLKNRVDEAIKHIQLETVLVTGHEVDLISQGQYRMSQELLVVIQKQQDAAIDRLIDRLGTRDNGAVNKPPCSTGTRSAILARITRWIEEGTRHGLCLSGQAGTGKSSIAASIARREKASDRLGALFHFTRDDQARNKAAILVVTRQLAFWQSGRLRSAIASAIEKDLDIPQIPLDDQFQKLILEPLQFLDNTGPILVVILDAMDECDQVYATAHWQGLRKAPKHSQVLHNDSWGTVVAVPLR
ncbi:hypothetical protein FRB94_010251 [Tulasnella sp. JGI-2019a]|nr:hypothetical protein FRB94_010251 [Tulasnella sp. JGI-2019a]KAG8999137.1 hypothetical protein FRB93_013294 [Tulasnella sp. JGI-2019a]